MHTLTASLESHGLRYGRRSGFLLVLPSVVHLTFRQLKNLSKFLTNSLVSVVSSSPKYSSAWKTDELRTYCVCMRDIKNYVNYTYCCYKHRHTCAAKLTRILEYEVRQIWSFFSLGSKDRPEVVLLRLYTLTKCSQLMCLSFFCNKNSITNT